MKDFDILKVLGTGGNFYIHKGTLSLSSISLQLDGVNLRIFNLRLLFWNIEGLRRRVCKDIRI